MAPSTNNIQRNTTLESIDNQDKTSEQNCMEAEVKVIILDPYYGQINPGTTTGRCLFNKATESA